MESHALYEVAHEVMITMVKFCEPLTRTCTSSQVQIDLICTKPCCSQARQARQVQIDLICTYA